MQDKTGLLVLATRNKQDHRANSVAVWKVHSKGVTPVPLQMQDAAPAIFYFGHLVTSYQRRGALNRVVVSLIPLVSCKGGDR